MLVKVYLFKRSRLIVEWNFSILPLLWGYPMDVLMWVSPANIKYSEKSFDINWLPLSEIFPKPSAALSGHHTPACSYGVYDWL